MVKVAIITFMGAKKTFERLLKKNPANRPKMDQNPFQGYVRVVPIQKNTISTPTEAITVQNSTKKCVFSPKIAFFSVFSLTAPPASKVRFSIIEPAFQKSLMGRFWVPGRPFGIYYYISPCSLLQ